MRLPVDITPPVAISENRYQIRQPDAVNPVRPVGANASARQAYYRKRQQQNGERGNQEAVPEEGHEERRSGGERRQAGDPVMLDTRTGADRRAGGHAEGDIGGVIDEVV